MAIDFFWNIHWISGDHVAAVATNDLAANRPRFPAGLAHFETLLADLQTIWGGAAAVADQKTTTGPLVKNEMA
jgi:hypothetical protein